MNNLQFRFIEVGSAAYESMIDLRMKVLLAPIGISRSYINPQKELTDYLIGAYTGEQLIGCCILTPVDKATIQLRQMAVADLKQKAGIGKALVQYAEDVAIEKGYQNVLLHARDNVLLFYQKCGYHSIGEPFVEVGIGHYKMIKNLTPNT